MSMIGTRVVRVEDPAFLTVGGSYVDDLAPMDALHVTFVRSVMAHAKIASIDTSEAEAHPDVVGVFTAESLGIEPVSPSLPMLHQKMQRLALAKDRVRFVGEAIVAVVSRTRQGGVDAAEGVAIDYDNLPLVMRPTDGIADGAELLFPEAETNVTFHIPADAEESDFIADAERAVMLEFRNHRMAPCPMEPRATVARWDEDEAGVLCLTQWSTTQGAHNTRDGLAKATGVDPDHVRVICPDVGGAFGAKNGNYPEDIVVALIARQLGQPVRWAETRSESMLGLVHARALDYRCLIGGQADGTITHYSLEISCDSGAYAEIGAVLPFLTKIMTSGVYKIPNIRFASTSVVTNTVPTGAYRGAGRPEATAAIERMVDAFAADIGMDPVEVRRRNMFRSDELPVTTSTGAAMDSGDYAAAMDAALDAAGYAELRADQALRRSSGEGPLLGIGISTYVEITNPMNNQEFGSVEIRPDGSALVLTGSSSHGQGHHTAFAQLASEYTGIPMDRIEVRHGDTADVKRGGGTGGSKSLQLGGSAIVQASDAVVERAKSLAADMLEANPADIVLDKEAGAFTVAGSPTISLSWAQVASGLAEKEPGARLLEEIDFKPTGATFPFGAHVAIVEVDRDTGRVELKRFVACDDAGVIVNPMIVEGQVHGGLAGGIGHAMMEEFSYDDEGNPITANFMDYGFPSAAEFPSFERVAMETPTPLNPLGAKGIGESGTIGATPAIQNAVVDALSHMGINHVDIPVTPQRVWTAMNGATG